MEIKGNYNTAKVFTNVIEQAAVEQIKELCDMEIFKNQKIRIMPDVHAGAGCTIGTTMTITDAVVPNMVGVDIGCGMEVSVLSEKEIDFNELDHIIRTYVPSGPNIRGSMHPFAQTVDLSKLKCIHSINAEYALLSIGTLGSGNHFIEVDKDEQNNLYIVIHSGSRHLGVEVAKYYQKKAAEDLKTAGLDEIIRELKSQGRFKEIQSEIQKWSASHKPIPSDTAWCKDELFDDYIHDMKLVQNFAMINRKTMMNEIISHLRVNVAESFTTIHNYIDVENMILRKGAVSAMKGEKLIIPINMRDGSLICIGKGNPDWNYSAPHGAGRLLSRAAARKEYSLEEYRKTMEGIYTTSVDETTLDECPMAYKSISDIVDNIHPTVDILEIIRPVYNFKAS